VQGDEVRYFVSSLVGPRFGAETFGELCPNAVYRYYREGNVVFARAGIYRPHGVGVVAATGATTCGVRADDGRQVFLGGWGSLIGDEGSACALGLLGLRVAVRAFKNLTPTPTSLLEAICQYYGLVKENFQRNLIYLAYQKPLSRTEIDGVATVVTKLAGQGDPIAERITAKVANDLSDLSLSTARWLFSATEAFDVVMAGGLVNAGELILIPFRRRLFEEFPKVVFQTGSEAPAVALGQLALHDIQEETC
jgi:N-acetylglucosamine kinase-like BadF-type ATPase